jgi:copper chaperone NosL
MTRPIPSSALALVVAALSGCDDEQVAQVPEPAALTREAIGHYDRMVVTDHRGPKAQIWREDAETPIWFSSVRDAFAYHMLPEEPDDVVVTYVTDMAKADSWATPGPGTWIRARSAAFVIGSDRRGGMGAEEPVPFGSEEAARAFAEAHGGEVVSFEGVPRDYVLSAPSEDARPRLKEGASMAAPMDGRRDPAGSGAE